MFVYLKKMVQRVGLTFLAIISVVAVGGLIFEFTGAGTTGQYYAAGGGRWYYSAQIAQLQPDEACIYSGFRPLDPWRVETNEFGTVVSLCNDNGRIVTVPVVQTVIVR